MNRWGFREGHMASELASNLGDSLGRSWLILAFLLASSTASPAQADGPATKTRSDEGVTVVVTQADEAKFPEIALEFEVKAADGSYILDAPRDAFRVTEYGRDAPILNFEAPESRVGRPTTIVLVVDRSGSMRQEDRIGGLKRAVARFLDDLPAGSTVAVVAFGSDVRLICPFTAEFGAVREAVDSLEADGATRYYDAVAQALELLASRDGRRAVLALTDGQDTDSRSSTLESVVAAARRLGLPVHTLGLGNEAKIAGDALRLMADGTRGRYYPAGRVDELRAIYEELARRLRSGYGLSYRSDRPTPDGTLRPVRVTYRDASLGGEAALFIPGMVVPADRWPRLFLLLIAALLALAVLPGRVGRRGRA